MDISKIKFDINDIIKLVGGASMLIAFRYDIVSEIRTNKVFDTADKQIINYRIIELEKCCNIATIRPKEISVPTYRPQ